MLAAKENITFIDFWIIYFQSTWSLPLYKNGEDASITLKANQEYYFDVTPSGQLTSDSFKSLNINQRDCHLDNEVPEQSIFKIYTQSNCKYECHVKMALESCQCIPWDFIFNNDTLG